MAKKKFVKYLPKAGSAVAVAVAMTVARLCPFALFNACIASQQSVKRCLLFLFRQRRIKLLMLREYFAPEFSFM